MRRVNTIVLLLIFLGIEFDVSAQSNINTELNWFVSASAGYQMSGIKSEDFVKSNYSPLLNISIGKWFSRELALQVGYKGRYFNAISDNIKHYYNYVYGDVILDFNELLLRREVSIYDLYVHVGSGLFYNFQYDQPNICASLGLSNNFNLYDNFIIKFDMSAIMGWDIYQGDEDILPGLSVGFTYML